MGNDGRQPSGGGSDSEFRPPASGASETIPALLVVGPDTDGERSVPVVDWIAVGRECAGVDERHRLLITDPAVSRTHLEVRLDFALDQAWLTDCSTNGTRLNGQRVERAVPMRLRPGDRLRIGAVEMQFRSRRFTAPDGGGLTSTGSPATGRRTNTVREVSVTKMAMAVGDIAGFSTIAEQTDDRVLLENVDRLFTRLRRILARHNGVLSNYVGDAFFATWESAALEVTALEYRTMPAAAREAMEKAAMEKAVMAAVAFAIEAAEAVPAIAAGLSVRDPDGGPLRMGWGVACGPAAVSQMTGRIVTVLGDATNVAFRLSGLAGRDGRPSVLVTSAVHRLAAGFAFTPLPAVQVKGRRQVVEVLAAGRM
jgi:class 3 adenylate cyclase